MKIGHIDNSAAAASAAATGIERKPGGAAAAVPAQEASAKVDLSSAASALAGHAVDGSFDQAKVDRIAQAIRDGKFEVNADAIADKLIANAQELLGSGRA